jgi:hypothetical protein
VSAPGTTLAGRKAIERIMADACSIATPGSGEPVLDPNTGQLTYPGSTAGYTGKCRIRPVSESAVAAGERLIVLTRYVVSIPMSADAKVDDRVTVTSSVLDPSLAGRVFRVVGVARGTHVTARRLDCEEETT